ncbi:MAG: formate hydrogenlyase [Anaerolineae bacterium]|nr:formate hydrogenlyase [Anaerolineae bacterium]
MMIAYSLLQGLLFVAAGPLVVGLLRWLKARLQRRQAAPVVQPYRDLVKLLRKQPVMPSTASALYRYAPIVVFACYAAPGFLAPVLYLPGEGVPSSGDLVILIALFAMARMAMGLAGMDAGAPFGGLGSSRELFLNVLTEPTLLFLAYALALIHRTTDLSSVMNANLQAGSLGVYAEPSLLLLGLSLALLLLVEAGRLPIDNPASHLELTMYGKAVHLEYGGPQLALLEWAEALRLTFMITLLLNLFFPGLLVSVGRPLWLNALIVLLFPLKLLIATAILALWESLQAKMRLRAILTPALTALALAIIAVMLAIAKRYML